MLPAIIIGIGVTVTATATAWLFDRATAKEHQRHDELRGDIDALNRRYSSMAAEHDRQQALQLSQSLQQLCSKMEAQYYELLNKVSLIDAELQLLPEQIATELNDEGLSPYRRRALQQSYCQVEDARCRLVAYKDYLDWYLAQIKAVRDTLDTEPSVSELKKHLDELTPPSPTLPAEWLYVGKVVLVEQDELDKDLPFNSRLHLGNNLGLQGWSNDLQRKLFFSYDDPQAIPLQITRQRSGKNGTRLFYACVARGVAWVEAIMSARPMAFEIERRVAKGYLAHTQGKAISAFLPRQMTPNPMLELLPGQQIQAWPELYNLTLDGSPGQQQSRGRIQLNMLDTAELGGTDEGSLYLYLPSELFSEQELMALRADDPTPWRLLHSDMEQDSGDLRLARHTLALNCQIDTKQACLRVSDVEDFEDRGQGYELPFMLIPADSALESSVLANPDGISALVAFINHLSSSEADSQTRMAQLKMLGQWQSVLDYQQAQLDITLVGQADKLQEQEQDLLLHFIVDDSQHQLLADFKAGFKAQQSSGFSPRCTLEYWGETAAGEFVWLNPLPARQQNRLEVTIDSDSMQLRLPQKWAQELQSTQVGATKTCLRLSLKLFDDALQRQQAALDAFRNDALVEPRLKQILLAPGSYTPQQDPFWQHRLREDLCWQNTQLTERQKQVIRTALSEQYLALIQGPPGTAKTTCIVEMLHQIFHHSPETRVLLVSQQHAAVDNALARFIDLHQALLEQQDVRLLRIGADDKVSGKLSDYTIKQKLNDFEQRSRRSALACTTEAEPLPELAHRWLYGVLGTEQEQQRLDKELNWMLLADHNLVGATCVGLASRRQSIDQLRFDLVIIDEAGRSTVPELMIPLLRARKVILIGDHFQLPPSVAPLLQTDEANDELPFLNECFLETSFFEGLYEQLPPTSKSFLAEQFRMPEKIGDLVAELFYSPDGERQLFNGRQLNEQDFVLPHTLIWKDVAGQQQQEGTSKYNREEAEAIVTFIKNLADKNNLPENTTESRVTHQPATPLGIAVITPYGAQKRLIRALMSELSSPAASGEYRLGQFNIRINTVDSFQGSEDEIVCYSTVRTRGNLRFILDWKRLNVACSRAKQSLLFFGDLEFLSRPGAAGKHRNLFAEVIARIPKHCRLRRKPDADGKSPRQATGKKATHSPNRPMGKPSKNRPPNDKQSRHKRHKRAPKTEQTV